MKWAIALGASALGGLAVWRRKKVKDDLRRAKEAGAQAVATANSRLRPAKDGAPATGDQVPPASVADGTTGSAPPGDAAPKTPSAQPAT